MASAMPADLRLHSQPHGITAHWLVPLCLVRETHVCIKTCWRCTRQHGGRDLNPQPVDRTLTTPPPRGGGKHWECGAHWGAWLVPRNMSLAHAGCLWAEFDRSWSCGTNTRVETRRNIGLLASRLSKSLEIVECDTERSATYDFLLADS